MCTPAGLVIAVIIAALCISTSEGFSDPSIEWDAVRKVVTAAIEDGAFPGAVAAVGTKQGLIFTQSFGHYTYGAAPPFSADKPMEYGTLFDLASCTKVVGATSAVAQFYQRGELNLNTKVMDILGKEFGSHGKADITVLNCLLHNAGYPPDPDPNYWEKEFGCPETMKEFPEENFSCQDRIFKGLLEQTLENPIGSKYVYSDLSFITLQYVVGYLARTLRYVEASDLIPGCMTEANSPAADQCYFEAYLRLHVFPLLGMHNTGFLPPRRLWENAAPTDNDTLYLKKVVQGQVSDGNAYALGGIAGHAGLFSNANDLFLLAHRVLFAEPDDSAFINSTTAKFFTTEYNHTQSSRALGWNTNDPGVFDEGWGLLCGTMSARTFTHIGFTGTQICADPERGLITIFLTNRVYPSVDNEKIEDVRRQFNTAVVQAFDA